MRMIYALSVKVQVAGALSLVCFVAPPFVQKAHAGCTSSSSTASLGTKSTSYFASSTLQVSHGINLSCSGSIASVGVDNTLRSKILSSKYTSTNGEMLLHRNNASTVQLVGDSIPFVVCREAGCGTPLVVNGDLLRAT